jgi:two-component sensor histidine kinase/CheY-like chemotaxis protein
MTSPVRHVLDSAIRILLVDDDDDDYVITRDLLVQVTIPKCALEWRSNYGDGLAAVLENRHDLYLLDYGLGAHDGIELVRAAVQNKVTGPILLLTAHDDSELDVLAAAAGATDYLLKEHITAPLLGRAIRYALARHKSHDALRRAAHEKALLLQEIHHRVKNNLQMISSLLNFQKEYVTDQHTLEILRETQSRVRSIALIHEKLYESPSLASVDMGAYARGLVSMLAQTHGSTVATDVRIADVVFPISIAVPCGLILSELMTNALKHAFPGQPRAANANMPAIVVELKYVDQYILSVSDNGVGLGANPHSASSLGARLVEMFAEQLGGTVAYSNGGGTRCVVTFPAAAAA